MSTRCSPTPCCRRPTPTSSTIVNARPPTSSCSTRPRRESPQTLQHLQPRYQFVPKSVVDPLPEHLAGHLRGQPRRRARCGARRSTRPSIDKVGRKALAAVNAKAPVKASGTPRQTAPARPRNSGQSGTVAADTKTDAAAPSALVPSKLQPSTRIRQHAPAGVIEAIKALGVEAGLSTCTRSRRTNAHPHPNPPSSWGGPGWG